MVQKIKFYNLLSVINCLMDMYFDTNISSVFVFFCFYFSFCLEEDL